jgi:hypothetical protein
MSDTIPNKFDAFMRDIRLAHPDVGLVPIAGAFVGTGIGLLIDVGATDAQIREMLEMRLTFEHDIRKKPAPAAGAPGAKA